MLLCIRYIDYSYSDCCPYTLDNITDRGGRTTSYIYDSIKRLMAVTNPDNTSIGLGYDANGNITQLSDANSNITTFGYDKDNRPVSKTYADGNHVSLAYNNTGLPLAYTNARGVTTTYAYDANHNLTGINYSDNTPDVAYQYDNYNRVTQRTDGMGTYGYSYNANSWLTYINNYRLEPIVCEYTPCPSTLHQVTISALTFQYDALGRITDMTPDGGQSTSYYYDDFNRLAYVWTRDYYWYSYVNANPLVQSLTRPNGSVTDYQYDNVNRLTGISNLNSSSQIINQYIYSYNAQDMRAKETITANNPIASPALGQVSYSYNQLNQLISATGKTFSYDADGNMTAGYTADGYPFTAGYDAENRLTALSYTAGGVANSINYYYSGDGFLAKRQVYQNGTLVSNTRYVRAGYLPIQERNGSNSVTREYTWGLNMGGGIGGLLNLKQGGQNYSYLYDGKGNVSALLYSNQTLAATYTYDPFGNLLAKTGTLNQPFQFSTKPYDEKTGLSYYGYRFYSPGIGRWVNRDPLEEEGGLNLYEFVGGNPVNWGDPDGLDKLYFNGTNLYWVDDFGDVIRRYRAASGPFGNGRLPNGLYTGSNLRLRTKKGMVCNGFGWSLDIKANFDSGRKNLRIHPDQYPPGTEGCIGANCKDSRRLYNDLRSYFGSGYDFIFVEVWY